MVDIDSRGGGVWRGVWVEVEVGGCSQGSQNINLGGFSFKVNADLRPFLASLAIVHNRWTDRQTMMNLWLDYIL